MRKLYYLSFFLFFTLLSWQFNLCFNSNLEAKSISLNPERLSALIASGQYTKALHQIHLKQFEKAKKTLRQRLLFMSAYTYLKNKKYDQAIKIFKNLKKNYPALSNYSQFYLAAALLGAKKPREAIEQLENLQKQKISPHLKSKVNSDLAMAYCQNKQRKAATSTFKQLIQTESSPQKIYQLKYDHSRCLLQLKQNQEAATALRNLYLNHPEGDLSDKILSLLQKIGQPLTYQEHLKRADQLLAKKRPYLASKDLEAAFQAYPGSIPISLEKKLAETYFNARKYPRAAQAFEKLKRSKPSEFGEEEQTKLAQSYSRSDQFNQALQAYEALRGIIKPSEIAGLDYKIAYIHMDKGDYSKANQQFIQLLQNHPKHPQKEKVLWFLGWNHYLLKKYPQALNYFEQLSKSFPNGKYSARTPYWRARILEKQGKKQLARQAYQKIATRDPFSYYGFLSLKKLEKNTDPYSPPTASWVKNLPKLTAPAKLYRNQTKTNSHQVLEELLAVGLWEDFLGELNNSQNHKKLSSTAQKLKREIKGSLNYQSAKNGDQNWSANYPAAYPNLVTFFSNNRQFPIAFTWAIMREESRFKPSALSSAQAIGLMQIIPPTGAQIARELGRNGFTPDSLYKPVVNIEYGVHYLATNLKKFNGNLPYTIASYNGGPHNVERWLKARPNREWDEFVEEIPYRETHYYVKKVLKSYYIYSRLYFSSER